MCKRNVQSLDRLLLDCTFFSRFGLSWVMLSSVADLFVCWWTSGKTRSAVVWKMVPSCLVVSLEGKK
jgi:hypothetical protein